MLWAPCVRVKATHWTSISNPKARPSDVREWANSPDRMATDDVGQPRREVAPLRIENEILKAAIYFARELL